MLPKIGSPEMSKLATQLDAMYILKCRTALEWDFDEEPEFETEQFIDEEAEYEKMMDRRAWQAEQHEPPEHW